MKSSGGTNHEPGADYPRPKPIAYRFHLEGEYRCRVSGPLDPWRRLHGALEANGYVLGDLLEASLSLLQHATKVPGKVAVAYPCLLHTLLCVYCVCLFPILLPCSGCRDRREVRADCRENLSRGKD